MIAQGKNSEALTFNIRKRFFPIFESVLKKILGILVNNFLEIRLAYGDTASKISGLSVGWKMISSQSLLLPLDTGNKFIINVEDKVSHVKISCGILKPYL
jgi:hypothetical protein